MKITYDREADAVYIEVREITDSNSYSLEIANYTVLDIDEDNNLLGIEILNASKVIDLSELVVKDVFYPNIFLG